MRNCPKQFPVSNSIIVTTIPSSTVARKFPLKPPPTLKSRIRFRRPKETLFKKVIIGAIMFTLLYSCCAEEVEIKATQSLFPQPISLKLADRNPTTEANQVTTSLQDLNSGSLMELTFDQSQSDTSVLDAGKQPMSGLNSGNRLTLDAKPLKEPRVNPNLREEVIASPQVGGETTPNSTQRELQIRFNDRPNRFFKTKGNQ